MKPLAIDIFCGLGGWTEGLLAEGYRVVGFDIERHRYMKRVDTQSESVKRPGLNWSDRTKRGSKDAQFNRPAELHPDMEWIEYPAQLVLQDVLTIHGSQFKDAQLIVASPPCQEYSYMAMPWSLAKQRQAEYENGTRDVKDLTRLFDACFRIQREACEAAGRHIPMVVENVRGAQKWVGRAKWNFGSFYLWGDVPALMPIVKTKRKTPVGSWDLTRNNYNKDHSWDTEGAKVPGFRFDGSGKSFQTASVEGIEGIPHCTKGHWTNPAEHEGAKNGGDWFNSASPSLQRRHGSKYSARKAASAQIAKIPFVLARHIAHVYRQGFAA